ncbi:MAG: glycerophosphodiester phosphodiesterase family protein, partial [Alistipes sp.]|nr:glycerophosphodiester phosphodiesterase family protein [Alistipes sp.]
MKNLYFKLFALLCGGVSLCQCSPSAAQNTATRVDTLLSILHNPLTDTVIVVAHRGEWRNSIENSIPSLESAIQMGVDVVELDVRRTADSQLILMHDATIDRTTNGSGAVAELTLDSIKRCFLRDRD